jgi:PKD repeat protein
MRLLSLLALFLSRSHFAVLALLAALAVASGCDKVPLLAPTESTITLTVNTTVVPVNGTADVIASVTESAGTPVQNGTVVTFTSSFGIIEPNEARTNGGKATVKFVASTQSGTAKIGAFSGATRATEVEIKVGGAAASRIILRADPQTIPATGGSTTIVATVLDEAGNRLGGVPVTFSTTAGQLSSGQGLTDSEGEARTTLTTPRTATVRANAGGLDAATIEVTAYSPAVTITAPTAGVEAGVPAVFTVEPVSSTTGNAIREVVIDFGDGTAPSRLSSVLARTTVAHVYARSGIYTINATVTDTQGIVGVSSLVVSVNEQSSVSVTLTGTPNPVSIGNASQQGLVSFTATTGGFGTGVAVQSYSWDFGDGTGAQTTGGTVNHRYTAPGTYIANVSVRTTTGTSGFAQFTVRVNP